VRGGAWGGLASNGGLSEGGTPTADPQSHERDWTRALIRVAPDTNVLVLSLFYDGYERAVLQAAID
jgi:hypothetical protein